MIELSKETEEMARILAVLRGISPEEAVHHQAVDESARQAGLKRPRRRMTVEEMLAMGAEIAAMPLLDKRSPQEIVDDINGP